jgi:DNA-binding SARP family transcriptional activator
MDDVPILVRTELGLALERSNKNVSVRSANLALKMARANGRSEDIEVALIRLAHLHFRQGRYGHTQLLAEEVLCDAAPDSLLRCDALRMLGNCAAELGDPDRAENYYHQAIDLARQLDYHYALYKCLHSLATNIYWPRGQFDLCLAAAQQALVQAQTLGLDDELWFPLADIAWVYWSTGQYELAGQIADQIEKFVAPDTLGEGFYCCLRAGLWEPTKYGLDEILSFYDRARSIAEATGDPGLNVEVRLGLACTYRAIKDLPTALAWADDALETTIRMNYRQFHGIALIERGRIMIDMENVAGAEKDFRSALQIASTLRSNFDIARASLYLAILLSAGNKPEANDFWQQVRQLIHGHGYSFLIERERSLILPWIADNLDSANPLPSQMSTALFEILAHVSPMPLLVKTLGQFTLQVGSNLVSKENLRQRRAGELFALLLSSPGYTLSSEQVTESMCPEKDIPSAVNFYHHAISALRRLLEPDLPDRRFPCRYLEVGEERVTLLLPPNSKIDFLDFEKHIQNKEWVQAISIYQGAYLPMYNYTEWTIFLRQHFADLYEQALLTQATERLNAGAASDCLDLVRRALFHTPWQEQAVELGMRAALALDDRITAIKFYQRLEKTLDKEFGISPQVEIRQLYSEVRKRSRRK